MKQQKFWPVFTLLAAAFAGCNDKQAASEGSAPPPIESSKPGACASGGGEVADEKTRAFFPKVSGDYCVDPNNASRSFGEAAQNSIDKACTELLDGECENYKQHGLKRVVTLRYIDGKGSPGAVNINLSEYASPEGAYGFFTLRVVGDTDPARDAPKPLEAGGAGALGSGIAYVWRGNYLAELSYTNELDSPEKLRENSARILPELAKAMGEQLSGDKALPKMAGALPKAEQIELGTRYLLGGALGGGESGPGAVGYYAAGDKRYRVVVVNASDEAAAKDIFSVLKKQPNAAKLDGLGFDALALERSAGEGEPSIEWVVGQRGDQVVAVLDEELVLGGELTADELGKLKLSRVEKGQKLQAFWAE